MGLILVIMVVGQWGPPFKPRIWLRPEEKQGKFYYNASNDDLVDVGCCLVPSVSCLMGVFSLRGRNLITPKMADRESISLWQRFSFKMGYKGGISYAGDVLSKPTDFTFVPDIYSWFYWLNSASFSILFLNKYYPRRIETGIEAGYLWTRLEDRVSNILDRTTQPGEEPWLSSGSEWRIDAIAVSGLFRSEIKENYFGQLGIRGYMAKGIDKERFYRYVTKTEYKNVTAEVSNVGWGVFIGVGREYKISKRFGLEILSLFEFDLGREISHTLPENMIWRRQADFDFSGFFLGAQFYYKGG